MKVKVRTPVVLAPQLLDCLAMAEPREEQRELKMQAASPELALTEESAPTCLALVSWRPLALAVEEELVAELVPD